MFPGQSQIDHVVDQLHQSPWKAVIACTGAGAGLQELLWSVPESSKTIMEAVFPYDRFALSDLIGHEPKKYCCRDTALWMATAAYRRATELVIRDGEKKPVIGLGLTASVATGRPKNGDHQGFIAVKTAGGTYTVSLKFEKGRLGRFEEGRLCDLIALNAMLAAVGLPQLPLAQCGLTSEEIVPSADTEFVVSPRSIERLADCVSDPFERPLFNPDGSRDGLDALDPKQHIIFPGSFHPLHFGHESMAVQTERMTGKKVVFAITGTHPDKGMIPLAELLERAEQFRWSWPVLFTPSAALYVEKARQFPGFGFLIGVDAVLGILDPKYYGGVRRRDEMLAELASLGTRFHVVGREIEGKFMTLDDVADLPVCRSLHEPPRTDRPKPSLGSRAKFGPPAIRSFRSSFEQVFLPVSGRWDVRSRDLR